MALRPLRRLAPVVLLGLSPSVLACSSGGSDQVDDASGDEAPITSNDAQIVDFTFSSEVIAPKGNDTRKAIVSQLFYTVGALTSADQVVVVSGEEDNTFRP